MGDRLASPIRFARAVACLAVSNRGTLDKPDGDANHRNACQEVGVVIEDTALLVMITCAE